jgi:hypothetical protein
MRPGRLVTRLWGRHGDSRYDKQLPPDTTSIQMPLSTKFTQNTALYQPMYKTYERHRVADDTVSGR